MDHKGCATVIPSVNRRTTALVDCPAKKDAKDRDSV